MKDIVGYEGLYAITTCGRVYNVKHNRFLKPIPEHQGYVRYALSKNGKVKFYYAHRLVAEHYIPSNGYTEINHKDEDKTHNYVSNLEWCNHTYNCNYGTRTKRLLETRRLNTHGTIHRNT